MRSPYTEVHSKSANLAQQLVLLRRNAESDIHPAAGVFADLAIFCASYSPPASSLRRFYYVPKNVSALCLIVSRSIPPPCSARIWPPPPRQLHVGRSFDRLTPGFSAGWAASDAISYYEAEF